MTTIQHRRAPARRVLLCALLSFLVSLSTSAYAEDDARWAELRRVFEQGEQDARRWSMGWTTAYGLYAALNIAAAEDTDDSEERLDAQVNAVKSTLALANILMTPQPHFAAREDFDDIYANRGAAGHAALARAEARRNALARQEQDRRGLSARLGPFAVNLLAGLTIALGDDRPGDGLISFASGMLVNELALRTQPDLATRHQAQALHLNIGDAVLKLEYEWSMMPNWATLSLRF